MIAECLRKHTGRSEDVRGRIEGGKVVVEIFSWLSSVSLG